MYQPRFRYFVLATCFAALYYLVISSSEFDGDLATFGHAMIASLQIQSTIGFAAPSRDHWARNAKVVAIITFHSITTVMFNIFLLGTLFARLSSAKNRAITVKLTSRAVIRSDPLVSKSYPFFEFRVGEIRRHQLLNLNVSVYFFTHREGKLFHREKLSIFPCGGIFLAVPTEVRHVLDEASPVWRYLSGQQPESLSPNFCSVCGESFACLEQLKLHMGFMADAKHRTALQALKSTPISLDAVRQVIASKYFEIIVLVEGTEPVTGSPIQIRHSYTVDDVEFGMTFRKCWDLVPSDLGKRIVVNFANFDQLS